MSGPVTILFTDLVNSTDLLRRLGDERAQRVLRAHHRLLTDIAGAHGGEEVKWLGDGLMSVFASAADAVRGAVAMQQTARRRAAGGRLVLRVGLHVGEALRDETDYFGTPVVIARRLCQRADGGQILCSDLIVGLLAGRHAFHFAAVAPLDRAGLPIPITPFEVLYHEDQGALLAQTPFVGRGPELARFDRRLQEARAGRGGALFVAGEPGIGKTRALEEFAETARMQEALVLWGRCYEGETARPYTPFAEALSDYVRHASTDALRTDLGATAPVVARMVPELRERLPDLPELIALQPDEERVRLLDGVAQFLLTVATRSPVALVVDDLHWADHGTVGMLRHVARLAPRGRLLLLGAYRDVDVDRTHPLWDVLGALPRETTYEQVALGGLDTTAVQELLDTIADRHVPPDVVHALTTETSGNPFFIREVLLHLVDEGMLGGTDGGGAYRIPFESMRIPDTVLQVIERRLARLTEPARRLLDVASAFTGTVRFDIASSVARLEEAPSLDALDEVLAAQMLRTTPDPYGYDFTHALVRHALYARLIPPRRAALHRRIAEAMERAYAADLDRHAAEIASQYHRSAGLPGAERGVARCLTAAQYAERAAAHGEVVTALRMALDLVPKNDPRRPQLTARLGLALAWSLSVEDAVRVAREAGGLLAAADGDVAAADYLATAVEAIWGAKPTPLAWDLVDDGLRYAGFRRDHTWARLMAHELILREAANPDFPGMPVDSPDYHELSRVIVDDLAGHPLGYATELWRRIIFSSRDEVLAHEPPKAFFLGFRAGEYRTALRLCRRECAVALHQGLLSVAARYGNIEARLECALGNLAASRKAFEEAAAITARVQGRPAITPQMGAAMADRVRVEGQGFEAIVAAAERAIARAAPESLWAMAPIRAATASFYAWLGRTDDARLALTQLLPGVDRAPGWTDNYALLIHYAVETLWALDDPRDADLLERNLGEKVLTPDFRYPGTDARLSMARLCALQGRPDQARAWFADARRVLDEQGARPLRAIADFDEAWMHLRHGGVGSGERARGLLDAALVQFRAIGMPGWIERAATLRAASLNPSREAEGGMKEDASTGRGAAAREEAEAPPSAALRQEGDYWTVGYGGQTSRLRDMKGLHYVAHLLRHPGREFHALEVMRAVAGPAVADGAAPAQGAAGPLLDSHAKAAYRRRLADLREELAEAEEFNDTGRVARAREEIEVITEQLAAGVGLGGRDRAIGADAERARSAVTHCVKTALRRITERVPALGRALAPCIRTGTFCAYSPDPARPLRWEP